MKIFDPKLTGSIEILNTITGDVTLAGNLNVEGGLGGAVTGSATASYIEYTNIDNKPSLLSGSAQIASDISGSLNSLSSSLEGRVSDQESFSSSLDATFATDADLNLVSSSVDSLNAATSSYALENSISGSSTSLSSSLASELLKNTTDTLTGDLTVTGTLTAQEFHTEFVSASILYDSGSTKFGDTSDDIHNFTGSLNVLGDSTLAGTLQAQPWLFRGMASQVEYHVLDNGNLNGPSWKFRYDSGTANRYVDFGYKDGFGNYYEGLKLLNNQTISWRGTDIVNSNAKWIGDIDAVAATINNDLTLNNSSPEVYFKTGATHYNWMIAAQENVDTALEFTPSNAVGVGGTYNTPALTLYANRNATFAGDITMSKSTSGGLYIKTTSNTEPFIAIQRNSGSNGVAVLRGIDGGHLYIDTGATGAGQSTKMVVQADGKVGIGTTSPEAKLDISNVAGATYALEISTPERNRALFYYNSASTSDAGYLGIKRGSVDALNHRFATSGNSAVCIGVGNFGIGTDSPQAQLHINEDTSNSYATLRLEGANRGGIIEMYNQTSYPVSSWTTDQSGNIFFATSGAFAATSLSTKFTILTGGNVGIGTTSPDEKLTVDGTVSGAYVRISNAASGDVSSGYMIYNGSNLDFNVYTNPTFGNTTLLTREALAIRAGGSERMRITSGGNVGIGTTSPNNGKVQIHTASAIAFSPTVFTNGANIRLQTGGTAAAGVTTGVSMGVGGAAEAYIGAVQTVSNYADIVFQTYHGAYGERMRIRSGGGIINHYRPAINVGQTAVGITSASTYGGMAMIWQNYVGNIGYDLVTWTLSQVTVLASQSISGGASARSYTAVSGVLKLTMGGSDTYQVYVSDITNSNG